MDDYSLSLLIGWPLAAVGTAATLFASVIEECLKTYHRSVLFEGLTPTRQERFEILLRREVDYFVAARLGRLASQTIAFAGMMFLFAAPRSPFRFEFSDVLYCSAISIGIGILMAGIIPAVWARNWAEPTLVRMLPFFNGMSLPLRPLVTVINVLERGVARVAGEEVQETPAEEFQDNIADHLDEATRDGVIGEGERRMIDSIIDFGTDTVREVMTPRTGMITIDIDASVAEAVAISNGHGHSRVPVTDGSRDQIVGIFNIRDAMALWEKRDADVPPLTGLMRPPVFVPETRRLAAVLGDLRSNRMHMAIVLDEFGGTAGLITLEDVLEEIVGDIQDEFDTSEPGESTAIPASGESTIFDAGIRVEDINNAIGAELPESQDYTSIGGLISARLGRIPAEGERLLVHGVVFTVIEANERVVRKVSARMSGSSPHGEEPGAAA